MRTQLDPLVSVESVIIHPNNSPVLLSSPSLCQRITSLCQPIFRVLPLLAAGLPFLRTPSVALLPLSVLPLISATPTPTPTPISLFPDINDTRINTYTNGSQVDPSVTSLLDGGIVVTWHGEEGQGDTPYGIFAQRYYANGALFGPEFRVNTYTTNDQYSPSTTSLIDGGFVVVWCGEGQGDSDVGIFAQRYDANGMLFGSEFQINNYTTNLQYFPDATNLPDGGFLVAWEGAGQEDYDGGIFAQRYYANGMLFGPEFRVNNYTTNYQRDLSITSLSDGGFVVTWYGEGQGDDYGVFAQRYYADGTLFGLEFRVNNYTTGPQGQPSATGLIDGGFVITWEGAGQGSTGLIGGIFAQRYYANGMLFGTQFLVNTYATGHQGRPSVASLPDGGFVVTWDGARQGDLDIGDIFAQRHYANGTLFGSEFRVNTNTTGRQLYARITSLADGGFVVIWLNEEEPSSPIFDIYGKRYDRLGNPIPWEQASLAVSNNPSFVGSNTPSNDTSHTSDDNISWQMAAAIGGAIGVAAIIVGIGVVAAKKNCFAKGERMERFDSTNSDIELIEQE